MTHALAIDVGGTTTRIGFIHRRSGNVCHLASHPTIPGLHRFPQFLGNLIKTHANLASDEQITLEQSVLVALPGNFEPGPKIILQSLSAQQLILPNETFPSHYLTDWLWHYAPTDLGLLAMNDALAQAMGGALALGNELTNQTVLYIGPGTGLGGAIIQCHPKRMTPITDGHIFDILIHFEGKRVPAEWVCSGQGILRHCGVSAQTIDRHPQLFEQHQSFFHAFTSACIELIHHIQHQTVEKHPPNPAWSAHDMAQASALSAVLLGGSIGTCASIGAQLNARISSLGLPTHAIESPTVSAFHGLHLWFGDCPT
jgi:predicted NBD/HSP70 family sugar kinase